MILSADSIQGVLFPISGTSQDDALKLWDTLFPGNSPDGFQRAASSPNLQSSASGERDGFNITVISQVGRVDLIFAPAMQSPIAGLVVGVPRIDDVEKAARTLTSFLKRLAVYLKLARVALVLDTAATVPVGEESTALIEMLADIPLPVGANEVVFQFNARRSFSISPEIAMNRLCSWTSGQVGFIAGGPGLHLNRGAVRMNPYVGLKIDVNTAQETRIPAELYAQTIDEICDEALQIHVNGFSRFK